MLAGLRILHPAARILCLTYAVDDYQKAYVDSVVSRAVKSGDARIHRVHMPPLAPSELGCDYHPNAAGQQKYADVLIPVVRQYLGVTSGIAPPRNRRKRAAPPPRSGSAETFIIPLRGGDPSQPMNSVDYSAGVDACGRLIDFGGCSGDAAL